MTDSIDWENHQYGHGIECRFTPREQFNGKPIKPELRKYIGTTVRLIALWRMDNDDLYPGEWALARDDRRSDVFPGATWIASGDVTPEDGE